jgi:hypothetical protein
LATAVGQHQIEKDQIIGGDIQIFTGAVQPRGPVDGMPVRDNLVAHRSAQHRIILNQQHTHICFSCSVCPPFYHWQS